MLTVSATGGISGWLRHSVLHTRLTLMDGHDGSLFSLRHAVPTEHGHCLSNSGQLGRLQNDSTHALDPNEPGHCFSTLVLDPNERGHCFSNSGQMGRLQNDSTHALDPNERGPCFSTRVLDPNERGQFQYTCTRP